MGIRSQEISSNMTPEQRDTEKIAQNQVLAAAFRPDRVSLFSAVVRIARICKVCGMGCNKHYIPHVLLVQLLVYGCHQTFPHVCEGLACETSL